MTNRDKKIPYSFTTPKAGWIDQFPDGDYTIGRGADPRPLGAKQFATAEPKRATAKKRAKSKAPGSREAAE